MENGIEGMEISGGEKEWGRRKGVWWCVFWWRMDEKEKGKK